MGYNENDFKGTTAFLSGNELSAHNQNEEAHPHILQKIEEAKQEGAELTKNKNQVMGYAGLNEKGEISHGQVPVIGSDKISNGAVNKDKLSDDLKGKLDNFVEKDGDKVLSDVNYTKAHDEAVQKIAGISTDVYNLKNNKAEKNTLNAHVQDGSVHMTAAERERLSRLPNVVKKGSGLKSVILNDDADNKADGDYSHAEGRNTKATGLMSHAQNLSTEANGDYSTAIGKFCKANGISSTAKGNSTQADGENSSAEGYHTKTTEKAIGAHAEGGNNTASGGYAHVEGMSNVASGERSHAQGYQVVASGEMAHAQGRGTIAAGVAQHVQGKFNVEDKKSEFAHIVGGGTSDDKRANIHTLDWQGNAWFAGDVYAGGTDTESGNILATQKYCDEARAVKKTVSGKGSVTITDISPFAHPIQITVRLPEKGSDLIARQDGVAVDVWGLAGYGPFELNWTRYEGNASELVFEATQAAAVIEVTYNADTGKVIANLEEGISNIDTSVDLQAVLEAGNSAENKAISLKNTGANTTARMTGDEFVLNGRNTETFIVSGGVRISSGGYDMFLQGGNAYVLNGGEPMFAMDFANKTIEGSDEMKAAFKAWLGI